MEKNIKQKIKKKYKDWKERIWNRQMPSGKIKKK